MCPCLETFFSRCPLTDASLPKLFFRREYFLYAVRWPVPASLIIFSAGFFFSRCPLTGASQPNYIFGGIFFSRYPFTGDSQPNYIFGGNIFFLAVHWPTPARKKKKKKKKFLPRKKKIRLRWGAPSAWCLNAWKIWPWLLSVFEKKLKKFIDTLRQKIFLIPPPTIHTVRVCR